jgi:hypothetical protein
MLAGLRVLDEEFVSSPASSTSPGGACSRRRSHRPPDCRCGADDRGRERLLRALDDARADALAELRAVLLKEHVWRSEEGLV